jgi:hypothetical protein
MEIIEQYFLPALLALLATMLHVVVWRRQDRWVNLCLGVYSGAYFLTSVLGATLLSFSEGAVLPFKWGLDLSILWTWKSATYWLLLYMPLVIVPLVVLCAEQFPHFSPSTRAPSLIPHSNFVPLTLWISVLGGFCIYQLAIHGYLGNANWAQFEGNFTLMIAMRIEMFSSLSNSFYGILYVALPCLSYYVLYEALTTWEKRWWVLFGGTIALFVFLSFSVMLKGLLVVFAIFLLIGVADLRRWRLWTIGQLMLPVVCLLTFQQTFMEEDWSFTDSIGLIVYRMASAHVYYVNVYPELRPYLGPDFALNLIGLAQPPTDGIDVFPYMYPQIIHLQGSAAAPAHTRAYAQAGLLFAVATMFVIGLAVVAVIHLRRRVTGPWSFALFMQGLNGLYFLTQTTVVDSIFSSFGFIWAVFALAPLAAWETVRPRESPHMPSSKVGLAPSVGGVETPRLDSDKSQAPIPLLFP